MARANPYRDAVHRLIEPKLGVEPDAVIATTYGIPHATVYAWRERAGKLPVPGSRRRAKRGDLLREAVLSALSVHVPVTSAEVHRRVTADVGDVSQRQVVRVLQDLIRYGQAKRTVGPHAWPVYVKLEVQHEHRG